MATHLRRFNHPKCHTNYSLSYTQPPETSIVHYRNFPFLAEPQPGSRFTGVTAGGISRKQDHPNITIYIPPPLGLGTTEKSATLHRSEDKPIVRAPWPQDFVSSEDSKKRGSPNTCSSSTEGAPSGHVMEAPADGSNMIDDIYRRSFYDTTSRRAGREYALPVPSVPKPTSTLEADADAARLKPKRFDSPPREWQKFSAQWDRVQLRDCASVAQRITLPNITENQKIAQARVKVAEEWANTLKQQERPPTEDMPHFNRLLPGYGGYLSRTPNMHKMMDIDEQLQSTFCSTARISYRHMPSWDHLTGRYARKGPLSKTVTLTYPYNPFSKAL